MCKGSFLTVFNLYYVKLNKNERKQNVVVKSGKVGMSHNPRLYELGECRWENIGLQL